MSKIVFFSDLHLFKWREFARVDSSGRNDRLADCEAVFQLVKRVAEKVSASAIVFAGDLFHKRSILDTETVNVGVDGIASLEPFHVLLVPGNHDQATKDGRVHSLALFRHLSHVQVADVDDLKLGRFNLAGFKIIGVPYTTPKRLVEIVKGETFDLAVVHAGFSGAKVGSYEYRPPEELLPTDLGKLPKGRVSVLSGHYHEPQTLLNGTIAYIGAPLQHTRSDAGSKRSIVVLDTKTGQIERVTNKNAPRFVTLTDKDIEEKDVDEWDVEGNFVDIVLSDEPHGGIEAFKRMCQKLPARGVNVVFTPPPSLPAKRLNVDPSMSLTTMVSKYIDQFAPPELDKKTLTNLMKEVLS